MCYIFSLKEIVLHHLEVSETSIPIYELVKEDAKTHWIIDQ
jgi:hypothetical protein